MNPSDEFERDLKRLRPRSVSVPVIAELETRLNTLSQRGARRPARVSMPILAAVWTCGFAIGAALMLMLAPRFQFPADAPNPRSEHLIAAAPEPHSPIARVDQIDDPPAQRGVAPRLVLPINWQHEERVRLPLRGVLTVGSALSNVAGLREGAVEFQPSPDPSTANGTPWNPPITQPRITRQELIQDILNEA